MAVHPEVIGPLVAAIDAVCDADPVALADADTVRELHRQLSRMEALTARATARFDHDGPWAADGARSSAAWVAVRCRIPLAQARRLVRLGRALWHMPLVEQAWVAGDLSAAQVSLLAAARTPATAEAFERDEAMLVGHGGELRHNRFCRVVAYWRQLADPDGAEHDAGRLDRERRAHLSDAMHGTKILDAVFTPIGGAIFQSVLRRIERAMFDTDRAAARRRLGREPTVLDLDRTPAQRRHDALVEMARRAAATPAGARLPEPLFTVLVGYETFAGRICELANGTVVSPGTLVPWLSEAWVERVVFDAPDRVKNVGVRRRLFRGATRRAVEIRDRECFHPTCAVRFDDCQIDHIEPWSMGGLTTDTNGRPACAFHNRDRHNRDRHRRHEPPP